GPLAGIFVCYLLAMLCRENGLMFGPMAVVFDLIWSRQAPDKAAVASPRRRWALYGALALVGIAFLLFRAVCLGPAPLPSSPYVHWPTEPGFWSWLAYKLLHNMVSLPLAIPYVPVADIPWLQARPAATLVLVLLLIGAALLFLFPLRRSWVAGGVLAGMALAM